MGEIRQTPGAGGQSSHALGDVIATAVVTAAVVPFAQTVAQKAAEDTYASVRTWLRELFQSSKSKRIPAGHRDSKLLIVNDPDPALHLSLIVPTNLSDRAIKALDSLDLDDVATASERDPVEKVRIYWDERTGIWRIER